MKIPISERSIEEFSNRKELLSKYNPLKEYPLIIAFDEKGKELDRINDHTRLGDAENHFRLLEKIYSGEVSQLRLNR